ncbi:hypothetical protein P3T76_014604 [Phytophthora citrophthora]|uniref:Uncharacterized protein n=1 Tax=Phytophthora citrophthora TaxID=4793 RepID=A0AAD9G0X6_9STRA|nr:hypothetical protein P3T76_014604 [Phytophthora citrophthora]
MKVGRSDDIPKRIVKHNSPRADFAVGGAKFLFGLKMVIEDTKKAERVTELRLTEVMEVHATPRLADSKVNPLAHPFQSTTQEDQPPVPKHRRIQPALRGFLPAPAFRPPPDFQPAPNFQPPLPDVTPPASDFPPHITPPATGFTPPDPPAGN